MTRFFFHISWEGSMYMDIDGQLFSDLKSAKAYAARTVRDLTEDGSYYVGCSVCIADEQGKELDRVSIGADVIRIS